VALGILKSRDAVDRLIALVKDENADEFLRAYAATSLGKIGDEKALPALEDAVRDKNLHVHRSAVMALGLFGGEATERIVAKVKDVAEKGRDPQAKNWAMISLGRLGGNNAKKTLLAAVEGEQKSTQAFAALGLALLGLKDKDEVVVETLRKTLADTKDPSVQGAFAVALGLLEDTASEGALTEIVKTQGTADTRGYAAIGLGLMRARNATPAIEAIVKDTNEPTLQRSGAIALGLMADRNVVNVLSEMLKTANTVDVLSSTAQALGTIGDHAAIEPLLQCWRDTSGKMVDQTRAYALTGIGILCEPTDVPKMSWVSRDLNYRAQLDSIKTLLNLL
jgi:HEAT repeat protein